MTHSMTGFASLRNQHAGFGWSWDIRSVNGRGFDLRLRLPDWIEGLEGAVRKAVGQAATRGSITVSLRLQREVEESAQRINSAVLDGVLSMLADIDNAARAKGLELTPPSPVEIAAMRGVVETAAQEDEAAALLAALSADLAPLLKAFNKMRADEGKALCAVLEGQLDTVEALVAEAVVAAEDRRAAQAESLRESLRRVTDNTDGADPDRVAQELALIAVKTDVREEIDRLGAHVAAARALLATAEPTGRKLDFLMQEFNREANTLCSKAQFQALTRIGLDLKAVIDQMREQVQNVE